VTAIGLIVGQAACGVVDPASEPADFTGVVYAVQDRDDPPYDGFLDLRDVKYSDGSPHDPGTAGFHVFDDTELLMRRPGSRLSHCDFELIDVGDTVYVWTTGAMLRSDPPQYLATRIEVLVTDPAG